MRLPSVARAKSQQAEDRAAQTSSHKNICEQTFGRIVASKIAIHPRLSLLLGVTVERGRIVDIDAVTDPARLRQLTLALLTD